jgi:cytochrome b
MKSVLIWDLPTRLFHWLLMASCCTAFALALAAPEHSKAFDSHMLLGLALVPVVAFRLLWGIAGSTYAKFSSFLYSPQDVYNFLRATVTGKPERYLGHNPAASYAIWAMIALVLGTVVSGLLIPGNKFIEELHEVVSYLLFGVVGAHLLGVMTHTVMHRENVAFSMLNGKKMANDHDGIPSSYPVVAVILFIVTGAWSAAVFNNYDFAVRKLEIPLIGSTIQMGKIEKNHDSHGDDD